MPGPTGLLIGGVRLDLAVRVDATIVNLRKIDEIAQAECVDAVRRAGDGFLDAVHRRVAYDTGFMYNNVRVEYTPKGYTFEGGWNEDDFSAAGLPFYPPFVEFGTSRQSAQPSILPAYDEVSKRLESDLARSLAQSLERVGV